MNSNPWPLVVLASVAIVAVTILGIFHVDASTITNMLILFGVGGVGGLALQMKSNLNGNLSRMADLVASALEKLSQSNPVANGTGNDTSGQAANGGNNNAGPPSA